MNCYSFIMSYSHSVKENHYIYAEQRIKSKLYFIDKKDTNLQSIEEHEGKEEHEEPSTNVTKKPIVLEDTLKHKEIDELTDVIVNITTQLETLKQEYNVIQHKYSVATKTIEQLTTQVQTLSQTNTEHTENELHQRKNTTTTTTSPNPTTLSPSPSPLLTPTTTITTSTISLHAWQWLIVAIMFFVLGRIFS